MGVAGFTANATGFSVDFAKSMDAVARPTPNSDQAMEAMLSSATPGRQARKQSGGAAGVRPQHFGEG